MTRTNNLFDLHKIREARISDDYKNLDVLYELKKPIGLKQDTVKTKLKSTLLDCIIEVDFKKNKLILKIEQDKSDLKKLYQIFLIIAYLLGSEITLFYKYKNFPFYDMPHYFNFGNYNFCFVNNRRLISSTKEVLETGYKLIHNRDSVFFKIVSFMLNINTIVSPDIRFFAEYSLLEHLSKTTRPAGIIFSKTKEKDNYRKLHKFSQEVIKFVNTRVKQDTFKTGIVKNKIDEIKKLISIDRLNQRGVEKEGIKNYIESFDSKRIVTFSKYIKNWADIRGKRGLAHGNVLNSSIPKKTKDRIFEDQLHELLSELVFEEFEIN